MVSLIRFYYLVFFSVSFSLSAFNQEKVGLVLSGGGAKGMVHIGVLKALEEYNVPIDYITGTSAGALVGAMYAVGYSPKQIEEIALTDAFQKMATGQMEVAHRYTYREQDPNPSMMQFGLRFNQSIIGAIPTHLRSSAYVDYSMLRFFGPANELAGNNFDNLFIPFRCIGADITNKKSVAFRSGKLNQAVRASMTYPFYFEPIEIDNLLYFDGGLYNNFPADILYEHFSPDFIIGVKVAGNFEPPKKNDIVSQITNMMVRETSFDIPCEQSILIAPQLNSSTFDFQDVELLIEQGYKETIKMMDSILSQIDRRVSQEDIQEKRREFRSQLLPFSISKVSTYSVQGESIPFARKTIINDKKNERLSNRNFEKRYFRLYATPQISFIFPTIDLQSDSSYHLHLALNKSKDFNFEAGGFFASRPINTAYVGISYNRVNNIATRWSLNAYLGRFYSALKSQIDFDIPSVRLPLYFSLYYVQNSFDFFRSFENFFVEEKPSYITEKENYTGLDFKRPLGNHAKIILQGRYFRIRNNYFQDNTIFAPSDTSDYTRFQGASFAIELQQNSLNRKQFASSGSFISLKLRYVYGTEHSLSGNIAPTAFDRTKYIEWIVLSADAQTFLIKNKNFKLGIHGIGVYNSLFGFANQTATELILTPYSPMPDMNTYYTKGYRTPIYAGVGINTIFKLYKNIDLRIEPYFYQNIRSFIVDINGESYYTTPFSFPVSRLIVSNSVVWHLPLGPLRFTINYYSGIFLTEPFTYQITFGYILFNQRAIR